MGKRIELPVIFRRKATEARTAPKKPVQVVVKRKKAKRLPADAVEALKAVRASRAAAMRRYRAKKAAE